MELIRGIRYSVTGPVTYKVTYLNGVETYTHPFALIDISAEHVRNVEQQTDMWVDGILATLTAAGASAAGVGAVVTGALSMIVKFAYHAAKDWIKNSDGSATIALSYHWAGSRKSGLDLTAYPIPGVDINVWYGIVNNLLKFRFNAIYANEIGLKSIDENTHFETFSIEAIGDSSQGSLNMNLINTEVEAFNNANTFYGRFSSCMQINKMPIPSNLFESQERLLQTVNSIYSMIYTLGTRVTLAELVAAGTLPEVFLVVGAVSAAYYLGVVIGCAINAGVNASQLPSIFW